MLFVYIVIIIGMVWSIVLKQFRHNHRKILRFFYLVVGLVVALAAVEWHKLSSPVAAVLWSRFRNI